VNSATVAPAFVILSAKYVGADLVAEFGQLPPSMLPNGGRPLYEAQCDMAEGFGARIVLVLPADYELPKPDQRRLAERAVQIVRPDASSNILDSIRVGLAATGDARELYLLFGDTLVPRREAWPMDSFAAGTTSHVAYWAEYIDDGTRCSFREVPPGGASGGTVLAGFMHFADTELLVRAAGQASEITELLNRYAADRPLRPITDVEWLDFGHLFTYHQSRCRELLARSFNSVTSDGHSVVKSGEPARKIFAEAQWYRQLPPRLRPYAPHFLSEREDASVSYELEYLYLPLLSEVYSFARLPRSAWDTILASCRDFLELMQSIAPRSHHVPADFPALFYDDMIGAKTRSRVQAFAMQRGLSLDVPWTFNGIQYGSLNELVERLTAMIRRTALADIVLWHGDFHFGNIFYDFRSRKVRVVDPRGMLSNGMLSIYGDARYDVAKLGHSVFGLYDQLIADRYELEHDGYDITLAFGDDPERAAVIAQYETMTMGRYATADKEAVAMVALLFLSMLPLHANNRRRQTALFGNALRLALRAEGMTAVGAVANAARVAA
jgi:hypothetical protein